MNIHPKITLTLLLASAISIISTAQTPPAQAPLWKVSKTELRNNDRQFVIVLERSVLEAGQQENPQIRKFAAVIRSDNSLLTYLPVNGMPTEKITVDLANKNECASLTALILDFRQVDASNKAKEAAHQVATGDEGKKVNSFSGTLGDFDVSYQTDISPETGNGKYGGAITLVSKDGDSTKDRNIVEPTALEQVLLAADSFRQMQQAAIQSKAQQLAAQKNLQDEQTQDELAKAKADSDARVKNEAALRQQQLAEQEKQQKLQAIKDAEVEARHNKALAFLATSEGTALAHQIDSLDSDITDLRAKERKPEIRKANELLKVALDLSLPEYERNEANRQASLLMSGSSYKPSDKLVGMQNKLNLLLTQFEQKSGMAYKDVVALRK